MERAAAVEPRLMLAPLLAVVLIALTVLALLLACRRHVRRSCDERLG
jgi:hypothetical protein